MKILKRKKFLLCGEEWELQVVDKLKLANARGQWWSATRIMQIKQVAQGDDTLFHEIVEAVCQMLCYSWEPRNLNNHELMLHVMTHAQHTNMVRDVWGVLIQLFPDLKKGVL